MKTIRCKLKQFALVLALMAVVLSHLALADSQSATYRHGPLPGRWRARYQDRRTEERVLAPLVVDRALDRHGIAPEGRL